jgi:ribosomal subunit interface protein
MQLIIKGRHTEVPETIKEYIQSKIEPILEKNLKEPTVCEVVLLDENGPRGGQDKTVHITASVPDIKNPIHVELSTDDYYKTIDLIGDKLSRALHNARR